jgi:hypothetical protein
MNFLFKTAASSTFYSSTINSTFTDVANHKNVKSIKNKDCQPRDR